MVGPEGITEPQLEHIRRLFFKLGWSAQYGLREFNEVYTVHITALEDMSLRDASKFIDYLKEQF